MNNEPTNYGFDMMASIVTTKPFNKITVPEFCNAIRERLARIEEENEIGSFGYVDEYPEPLNQ
tara:strand:+ start:470 stop:658 length:189 start_codon:yes stop_codon:yes gene_type:complete